MTSTRMLHRVGILAVVTLFAAGMSLNPLHAQNSAKPDASAETAKKKKDAEKKDAAKQTETTQKSSGSVPMSGFRPDPVTNY